MLGILLVPVLLKPTDSSQSLTNGTQQNDTQPTPTITLSPTRKEPSTPQQLHPNQQSKLPYQPHN